MIAATNFHTEGLFECLVIVILFALLIALLAWFIPPTRAYATAIGGVVFVVGALLCLAGAT
jgi:hypothetical protein